MTLTHIHNLERDLLDSIMKICEIQDSVPDDMTENTPLIGPDSPFGLDSLDAVEIIVMIQTQYGVRITSRETSIEVLNSLKSIADYITDSNDDDGVAKAIEKFVL